MSTKPISKAAEKMNEETIVKKFGSRSSEVKEKDDSFVRYGEFGKYHGFANTIVKKETGDYLLKKPKMNETLTFSGKLINYISLNYTKEQIFDLLQSEILKNDIDCNILKEIYLKDDFLLMTLNKDVILKKKNEETMIEASMRHLENYIDLEKIPQCVIDLTLQNQIYSFGDEFALKLSYQKIASRLIAMKILTITKAKLVKPKETAKDTEESMKEKEENASKMNDDIIASTKIQVLKTWQLGTIIVRNNIVAICFCMPTPNDYTNIRVKKENFVTAQFCQELSEFGRIAYESYLNKIDKSSSLVWASLGNVLESIKNESTQKSYILKSKDTANSLMKVPLIKLETSNYIDDKIPEYLKQIAKISTIQTSLDDSNIASSFSEVINSSLVTLVTLEKDTFLVLPDLYKIVHAAILGEIDYSLKTSVRTTDTHIAIAFTI